MKSGGKLLRLLILKFGYCDYLDNASVFMPALPWLVRKYVFKSNLMSVITIIMCFFALNAYRKRSQHALYLAMETNKLNSFDFKCKMYINLLF